MRILCVCARYNYGDPARGDGYEYTNFIPALERLGHEVHFFDNYERKRFTDFRQLNQEFLRCVERIQPDIVFSVQLHYEIWLETWRLLRDSPAIATINWTTDDSWKYRQFSRFLADAFDVFTTTYASAFEQYKKDGYSNVMLSQWAANDDQLHPPRPASECSLQVSFVGSAHGRRPEYIDALRRAGIAVECYGYGWPRGPVAAERIPEIVRDSVISLNFAGGGMDSRTGSNQQLKARTFEVPGYGGFLLTEHVRGIEQWYDPGTEIATYRKFDELVESIRYYCSHPEFRDRVARAGHERTARDHTYSHRLALVLAQAVAQKALNTPGVAARTVFDWDRFNAVAARHQPARGSALIPALLTRIAAVFWGRSRARRAVRRLFFEISWRAVGRKTYSASGLPGRLFYDVS